ncbi:DUF397 domain-containing protein [Streptomyces sp. NPDC002067]
MTPRPRLTSAEILAASWRKSSYSGGGGNECVEIAELGAAGAVVAVRDSKQIPGAGPTLAFSRAAFAAFVEDVRA